MTARIVCGAGVPHVPLFPRAAADGDTDVARRYAAVRGALAAADPTLVIAIGTDHVNAFFLDRVPTFALTVGERLSGPIDDVPGVPAAALRTDAAAAGALAERLVGAGFDLLLWREATVDHSVVVPLHFLCPAGTPVVALLVNAYVPPLPSARRCHALGAALVAAVEALPDEARVAVVASGAFSQEVGGPRVDPGRSWSVPRPDWAAHVASALRDGDLDGLLDAATPAMLADAGTVAGELLTWIVVAGAMGGGLTAEIDHRRGEAFAYGAWVRR